jgi:hypothetical protein
MMIFLLFVVTVINYADRATFSIAGSAASDELGLSPVAMGWILSPKFQRAHCWTASDRKQSIPPL